MIVFILIQSRLKLLVNDVKNGQAVCFDFFFQNLIIREAI
jgi:hypothetical protein